MQPPSTGFFTRRRLSVAGIAALLGCAACCALPLLGLAGVSTGAATALSAVASPGNELLVGGLVFVGALAVLALRRRRATGCGESCRADGSCCDKGAATQP